MRSKKGSLIAFCVTLSIFLGLSLDIYIPSLTRIQSYFSTTDQTIQLTLSVFLFGYAFSQLVYGVVSDAIGRKKPLIIGLIIYLIGNVGCLLSVSVDMFTICRLIESFGAASAIVTAYAIARDSFSDIECTKIFSYMAIATSVAPIVLSIAGGYITTQLGWRYIFAIVSTFTLSILIACIAKLPETAKNRHELNMTNYFSGYIQIIKNKHFLVYASCGASIFVTLFCFISAIPLIASHVLEISLDNLGWLLGMNSLFLIFGYLIGSSAKSVGNRRLL